MIKTHLKELPAYQFHLLQKYSGDVQHAVFTRHGGVSDGAFESLNVRFGIGDAEDAVFENRLRIADAISIDPRIPNILVSANQTHSKNVFVIDDNSELTSLERGEIEDTDAIVSGVRGTTLMVQVADCQAILMFDPASGVIAAVHAGWRGLVHDISGEVINIMQERFGVNPSGILVGISPSLGSCCSFFTNPAEELPEDFAAFSDSERRVDLWGYSEAQLQSHGILPNHIEVARVCTQCENGRTKNEDRSKAQFFSFRGDKGITGRFGVVIAN